MTIVIAVQWSGAFFQCHRMCLHVRQLSALQNVNASSGSLERAVTKTIRPLLHWWTEHFLIIVLWKGEDLNLTKYLSLKFFLFTNLALRCTSHVFCFGLSAGGTLAANCSAALWELSEHKLHT